MATQDLGSSSHSNEPKWSPLDDLEIGHFHACPADKSSHDPCPNRTAKKKRKTRGRIIEVLEQMPPHVVELDSLAELAKWCVCHEHEKKKFINGVLEDWKYHMMKKYGVAVGKVSM